MISHRKKQLQSRTVLFLCLLILATVFVPAAFAQDVDQELAAAQAKMSDARSRQVHLMAPSGFEKAEKNLNEAMKKKEEGKIDDALEKLAKFNTEIDKCFAVEEVGNVLLAETLKARQDALTSNAPEFASKEWAEAEKSIRKVGQKVEKGDGEKARKDAEKTTDLYRAAELQAIRVDLLGRVRTQGEEAVAANAEKWAPVTLKSAQDLLAEAENILQTDRYRQAEARDMAAVAGDQFKHATWIAGGVKTLDEDLVNFEAMILRHEEKLSILAEQLGIVPDFSAGFTPMAEDMFAAVVALEADRMDLEADVAALLIEVTELRKSTAALEPLKELENKVKKVQSMYTAGEAEVVVSDGRLVVHLYKMSFASGSAQIQPEDFDTLTKVKRTLRVFPGNAAVIEGHTDSTGDSDFNFDLSQRRADAVRSYLLSNMSRDEGAISAVGYGPSRPVADNSSEEGRAMNRRIDVVIYLDTP
jgi:outer membrane protein OmpA-like peptidoglycan-associated protein